ncbi:NTP transferase domain-containing protein [Pseudobdellovibrio exovorus]|uniref:MobA-like NTP transferase domain-containing protein n=1 Tax=Pseudobdellovibrio exovorus JSS TaxID=1184267 RepID=M4VTN6_9BACT|nr:NTP transferase domain-containing protein [Pseudobdellovibrio exovorus]AGH96559.1 hypothetical protein A11Q_2343 [Pseudobdellovibrio exovorus JSS]
MSNKIQLPQVCILAAGQGKRMGSLAKTLNKSLFPLDRKAVLSHIIAKFPQGTEFVIAVGNKAEQVKQYLSLAHPALLVTYVTVENYNGIGSGPGHSVLCCKEALTRAFYLVTADTLWTDDTQSFPIDKNWLAVSSIDTDETKNYCNVILQSDRVTEIRDKVLVTDVQSKAFTGLAFIKSKDLFWKGLVAEKTEDSKEKQLAAGFNEIVKSDVLNTIDINWTDVGTEEKYLAVAPNDLKRALNSENEICYFVENRNLKFPLEKIEK